jgi:hypothetical protein
VPGGIEELKSFVGIIGRPPPPACSSVIVEVRDTERPNIAQNSNILTGTFPEKGSQGPEVIEVEGFANIEVDWCSRSVLCGSQVRMTKVDYA